MLVLVLILGVRDGGAVRAIDLGVATLQPAEFAKLGCVLVTASIMARRAARPGSPRKNDLIEGGLAVGVPFALVMMQPDMGMAMSIMIVVVIVLAIGGLPWRYIVAAFGAGVIGVAALVVTKGYEYTRDRIRIFLDPGLDPLGSGYQINQARIALGSGGLLGVGLGMSHQKYGYLPTPHTDFIFAIIGEELGLVGCVAVVIAFGLFGYAGLRLALSTKDAYARFVAAGLTAMIVAQALINMASVTGLMPVAGEPLPLVSYGGSSLVLTLACIGLILGVTKEGERTGKARAPARRG
jgi:cell division protein FtsW